MKKKNEFTFGWKSFIVFTFILLIVYVVGHKIASHSNEGEYDYCIEWDGFINRDNMIYNCYNFINDTIKCEYGFQDDNTLRVWYPDGTIRRFECSMYVKSKKVVR